MCHQSHSIKIVLMQCPRAATESRWEDYRGSDSSWLRGARGRLHTSFAHCVCCAFNSKIASSALSFSK